MLMLTLAIVDIIREFNTKLHALVCVCKEDLRTTMDKKLNWCQRSRTIIHLYVYVTL